MKTQPHSQDQLPGATASVSKSPKRISGRVQSYQVQAFAFNCLMVMERALTVKGELKLSREDAQAVSSLVRAWESAQERVRIHRNKPLPGSLRPVAKPKRSARSRLEPSPIPQGPITIPANNPQIANDFAPVVEPMV
jgi:hypothetical protein